MPLGCHALDYLLKPFAEERLRKRMRIRVEEPPTGGDGALVRTAGVHNVGDADRSERTRMAEVS